MRVTRWSRWPGWLYRSGDEPDYRFSFANERTFLAWIRTALALLAAGVALDTLDVSISRQSQHLLSGILVMSGLALASVSWLRWAKAEWAMRHQRPLPAARINAVLAVVVASIAVSVLIAWR